jgi:hypothetical protein
MWTIYSQSQDAEDVRVVGAKMSLGNFCSRRLGKLKSTAIQTSESHHWQKAHYYLVLSVIRC